jgi:putative phosphonate metabolism protein
MTTRYAIYFAAAPESPLERFGVGWLGRDHRNGAPVEQLVSDVLDPHRRQEITADARHYGFHATLKPPFALADGRTAEDLHAALSAFAGGRAAFDAPPLRLRNHEGFLAMVLSADSRAMQALADDCVTAFDHFRAPAPPEELARRRKAGLSPRQELMLQRWGYPLVMEEFRFHMTLTKRLPAAEAAAIEATLAPHAAPLCTEPLRVDALSLFMQPSADAPFMMTGRYAFGA